MTDPKNTFLPPEVAAAQARLLQRRNAAQSEDDQAIFGAQRTLLDARRRTPPAPAVERAPWLHVVRSLSVHAAQPSTAAAIAQEEARLDAIARASLVSTARRAELPEHPDLLEVAVADTPRETTALRAFREVFERISQQPRRRPVARVVAGPAGTGKTAAAAWAVLHQRPGNPLRQQVVAANAALFVPAAAVATTPRNGFSSNADAWQRWLSVTVLVVDDAGTEPGDASLLASLFIERWARPTVTLVTTNLDARSFWARYPSSRLADRWITEQRASGFEWFVSTDGASLRGGA